MFSDHIETMYFLILPVNGFSFAKKNNFDDFFIEVIMYQTN